MTEKDHTQYQLQQVALLTIESILRSQHVLDDASKLRLIGYVTGAATQSMPELEFNA